MNEVTQMLAIRIVVVCNGTASHNVMWITFTSNEDGKRGKEMKTKSLLTCVMVVSCTIVAATVLAADKKPEAKNESAKQWQHLELTASDGPKKRELAKTINKLGREGWELVSVVNSSKAGTTIKTAFYFKRPLQH